MTLIQHYAADARPLTIALAHWCVREHPGSPRWKVVNRLCAQMDSAQKIRFRAELAECRAARRSQREAKVA
jgi:hypothetical protein